MERITHAAKLFDSGLIKIDKKHSDINIESDICVEGFYTSDNRFVSRTIANEIAFDANQISELQYELCCNGLTTEMFWGNNYQYNDEMGYYKDE